MREPEAAAAKRAPLAPEAADQSLRLVCLALTLALAALLCRIASVW